MRGLTVALMILVNNGGEHLRPLLRSHPRRHGHLDVQEEDIHQAIVQICTEKSTLLY